MILLIADTALRLQEAFNIICSATLKDTADLRRYIFTNFGHFENREQIAYYIL